MNKLKTVLLVDDDEATNFINRLLIQKLNLTDDLQVARNGKEAIEYLQKLNGETDLEQNMLPELILLDINMPVMDGFGFLKAYESLNLPGKEGVVIAVLTTSFNPKDLEKIKATGITDFLNKPLTKSTFTELVEKHYGALN